MLLSEPNSAPRVPLRRTFLYKPGSAPKMPLLDRTVALPLTWQVATGLQQHAVAQQQLPRALPATAEGVRLQ